MRSKLTKMTMTTKSKSDDATCLLVEDKSVFRVGPVVENIQDHENESKRRQFGDGV